MDLIKWARAVCYSGYRRGQHPDTGVFPTEEQIVEDLEIIIAKGFKYIRMYDPNPYAENVCKLIREKKYDLKLMLGPGFTNEVNNVGCEWNHTVYTDEQLAEKRLHNEKNIQKLVDIANAYPDVVFAVSIGNENTPTWGENTVPVERLKMYATKLKTETKALVTFNEGAREWDRLKELGDMLDVICIHSYPMWYGNTVDTAVQANKDDYSRIKALFPDKQVLFSECGWATSASYPKNKQILKENPTEENQVKYYEEFWKWTDAEKITAFVFEAFDEPWKGGADEDEAEKHWGLYHEDRSPKIIMK